MTTATLAPESFRTFGSGADTLEHPVDVLGRARFRASIDRSSVHVTRSADPMSAIPFGGTAILFNQRTWIGTREYGYWEQIAPEAITKTTNEADVRFLQNHDPNLLLARTNPKMRDAGTSTLVLTPTLAGLGVEADMAPVSYAHDLAILLERGDISQMSFAFEPIAWTRETLPDGSMLITITELRLYDVSVVTYPAYEETDAGLRAAAFDALCRDGGLDPAAVLRRFVNGGDMPETEPTMRSTAAAPAEIKRAMSPGDQTRSLNGWTYSDLWGLLDAAVVELYSRPDFNAYWYVGVYDISDTWLVYWDRRPGNDTTIYWQCDYTVDADGTITLGTPVQVTPKTTYIAISGTDAPSTDAGDVPASEFAAPSALAQRMAEQRHAQLERHMTTTGAG